jgi:hypothetical protein
MARSTLEIIIQMVKKGGGDRETIRGLNDVKRAWTTGLAVVGAATAAYAVADRMIVQTANSAADYAIRMGDMSRTTGIQVEQMSRLVQAADDVQVKQDQLNKALEFAVRQGYEPSVEWLGQMADQINGMPPGAQRAEESTRLFGKAAGPDMLKLLELGAEGIEEYMAAAEDGLVVTQQSYQEALEYKRSVDALQDSLAAIKQEAGEEFVPVLTDVADAVRTNITLTRQQRMTLVYLNDAFHDGRITMQEYNAKFNELGIATEYNITAGRSYTEWARHMHEAMQDVSAAAEDQTDNFNFLLDASRNYFSISQEIADIEADIAEQRAAGKTEGDPALDGLIADLDAAKAKSQELANQMVLDFYKMQISADGVITQEELDSYFGLAEAMGMTDENATNAALALLSVAQAVGGLPDSKAIDIYIRTHGGNVVAGVEAYQADLAADAEIQNRGGRYGETIDNQDLRAYATGGLLGRANVVGEKGWEAVIRRDDGSYVVIPHEMSQFLADHGLLPVDAAYGGGGTFNTVTKGSRRDAVNAMIKSSSPTGKSLASSGDSVWMKSDAGADAVQVAEASGAVAAAAAADAVAPLMQDTMSTFTASTQQNAQQVSQQTRMMERGNQETVEELRATRRAVETLAEQVAAELQKNR